MQGFQGIPPNTIFGGYKEVARPDPIPNSAVKRFIADGSDCIAFARVGCRHILPTGAKGPRFFCINANGG